MLWCCAGAASCAAWSVAISTHSPVGWPQNLGPLQSPAQHTGVVGTSSATGICGRSLATAPRRLDRLSMSMRPGDLSDDLPFVDDSKYVSYAERLAHSFTVNSHPDKDGTGEKGRPCFGFFTEDGPWRWATYAQVGRQLKNLSQFLKWDAQPDPKNGIVGELSTCQKLLAMRATGNLDNKENFQFPEAGTVPLVVLFKRSDELWYALDFAAQLSGYAVVGIDTHTSDQNLELLLSKFKPSAIVYDASTQEKVHRVMVSRYTQDAGAAPNEHGANFRLRLVYAATAGTSFELELSAWLDSVPSSLAARIDHIPQELLVPDDLEPATLGGSDESLDSCDPFFGHVVHARRPDALCRLILTSGSSGLPKGAALGDCAWTRRTSPMFTFDSLDVAPDFERSWVSMQPAAHILDLKQVSETILRGGKVGFRHSPFACARGDSTKQLWDTFAETRPTYLTAVPAIWRQVQQEYVELVADPEIGSEEKAREVVRKNILGGSLKKGAVVGAKPDAELLKFVRTVVKKNVTRGSDIGSPRNPKAPDRYASTEAHTVLSSGKVDFRNKVKVKILPSEKSSDKSEGELLVQSPNLFLGYFGDPDATEDAFWTDSETGERWYKTGDIAKVDASGKYSIVGRATDSVKMANGEFVNTLSTENKYWEKMGEELQREIDFLKINIRPGEDGVVPMVVLRDLDSSQTSVGRPSLSRSKTSSDPSVAKSAFLDTFVTKLKASENFEHGEAFGSFEFPPKGIVAIPRADFELWREWGLMTGTGKPIAHQIAKRYEAQLNVIYEESKREKEAKIGSPEQIAAMKEQITIGNAESASTEERRMALIAHVALALQMPCVEALLQEAKSDPLANLSLLGLNSLNAARLAKPISEIINAQNQNAGKPAVTVTPPMLLEATVNDLVCWLNEGDGTGSVPSPAILQMINDMRPTTRLERLVKGKRLKQFKLPDSTGVHDATVPKVLNVFVTGATGAVAAVVVDELLKLQLNDIGVEVHVTCLVRGDSDEAAKTRLLNQIASVRGFGSDSSFTGPGRHLDARVQELAKEVQRGRVRVVRGNIAQENFGLSDHNFTRLALDADVILHSSAAVNHVHPYSWHREANAVATQRVLEFAASTGKDYFTPLHFISSSNVVFGNRGGTSSVVDNTDMDQNLLEGADLSTEENLLERVDLFSALAAVERAGETGTATLTPIGNWLVSLPNGYMQSKFVSEGLCRNTIKLLAKQAGGTNPLNDARAALTVYRPGVLTSHRQTGFCKVDDLYPRLLMAMRSLKIYPTIPDTARYEMTPNDVFAKTTVAVLVTKTILSGMENVEIVADAMRYSSTNLGSYAESVLRTLFNSDDVASMGSSILDSVASDTFHPISKEVEVPFKCLVDGVKLALPEEGAKLEEVSFSLFVERIRKAAEVGANEDANRLLPLLHEIRRRGRPSARQIDTSCFEAASSFLAIVKESNQCAPQSQITPETIQRCIDFCVQSGQIPDGTESHCHVEP